MAASTADPAATVSSSRRPRRGRFRQILFAVTMAMHVPVALAVSEVARRLGVPGAGFVGLAWAVLGAALFVDRVRAAMTDRKGRTAIATMLDLLYFVHWCAAVWTLVPALVETLVLPAIDLARGAPLHLPMGAYMWTYLSGLVVSVYGVMIRRRWFRVVERELAVPGLDARLDGLRVAHLSDLHVGTFTPRSWALAWARAANARSVDLAVVTGDLVTSGTEFHEDIAEAVSSLRAPMGVFASMGNHDYFGDGEPLVSMLVARGVSVLRNEGRALERHGATLWLAAIDDTWTRRDDVAAAMRGRPAGATTVLLAHDPARFDEAADAGAEVVLSGHTHGGQVAVPFLARWLSFSSLAHGYNVGFYRRGRSTLYVHPGLGTTGPPIRIGVAPEVTILVLRAA
jgi:predicted MPP superfamily phosphohydrolase